MKDAGFVTARKEGTMIYYSVNVDREGVKKVRNLIDHIDKLIAAESIDEEEL